MGKINNSCLNNTFWRVDSHGQGNLFYIDGVWYSSVVQYYYANKFRYNVSEVDIIMSIHDAHKLVSKYKKIRLTDAKYQEWKTFNLSILMRGMYSKFEQNVHILKELLECPESRLDQIKDGAFNKSINKFLLFELDPSTCLKKIQQIYKVRLPITLRSPESELRPYLAKKIEEYTYWQIA